jgi:CubicO group peptidase (beta-lactamase class C family)
MRSDRFLPILGLLLAACGDSSVTPRVYDTAAIEAQVDAWLAATPEVGGAGLIIVHRDDGVVLEAAFGSHQPGRISLVASSSKAPTAMVLLGVQDQGLLDLNEPIVDAVGEWEGSNPEVTPAQLLSNSSGLVGLAGNPTYGPYLCQYIYTGTMQECATRIFTTPDDNAEVIQPDTAFRYGGGQWQVAGGVAEIVTGKSWATLVDEILVEPCGMEGFGYTNPFVMLPASPLGPFAYPDFDGDLDDLLPTENPNMEGGLYTTTSAYGKILEINLTGGSCGGRRVLSEEAIEQSHRNRIGEVYGGSTGGAWGGYGLGWWVDDETGLLFDPGAFGSVAWLDKERGYGAFVVIEATSGLGVSLAYEILPLIEDAIDNR